MTDIWSREKRSEVMSRIRGKDTGPELLLRRALHGVGARYRIHDGTVPGRPDVSHKGARVAVFVDGCFWHGCPEHYQKPDNNEAFWEEKLAENQRRREEVIEQLRDDGWQIFELWECEVQERPVALAREIAEAIGRRRD